jgi:hypothetical protein
MSRCPLCRVAVDAGGGSNPHGREQVERMRGGDVVEFL